MKIPLSKKTQNAGYGLLKEPLLLDNQKIDRLLNNLTRVDFGSSIFNEYSNRSNLFSMTHGDIEEWLKGLLPTTRLIVEPKICGCAIAMLYEGGILKKAININGVDKTDKIKHIENVPKSIPIRKALQVRGELYGRDILPACSQRFAQEYLGGKVDQGNGLDFIGFQIINSDLNHYQSLKALEMLGFEIPQSEFTHYTNEAYFYFRLWKESNLFCEYPTDGIVLKVNSRKFQKQLGETDISLGLAYCMEI